MLHRVFITIAVCVLIANRLHAQTTRPASVDPALWDRMLQVNQLSEKVADLTAHFEQQKFTPMLKKPLTSSGTVRVLGSTMRWDTDKPEPSVILADEKEFRLYYPTQKLVEIYPIDKRLAS